jgi:hypothetical protein
VVPMRFMISAACCCRFRRVPRLHHHTGQVPDSRDTRLGDGSVVCILGCPSSVINGSLQCVRSPLAAMLSKARVSRSDADRAAVMSTAGHGPGGH